MIDKLVQVASHPPIAARGVRVQPTARSHREVCRLLYRLDREITGRMDHDSSLAADPGDNGGPVLVIMPPAGLALLPAPTRTASQCFLPALLRLSLLPSGVIEVIRFHGALQLTLRLIGKRGIAEPPTPPITGTDMDPLLSGNTSRRVCVALEQCSDYPDRQERLA